jgi:phenylacetate-CoA ligase
MKFIKLYYRLPPLGKDFVASGYGLKQKLQKFGTAGLNQYNFITQLRKSQWYAYQTIIENQKKALIKIILHAKNTVSYYRKVLNQVDNLEIKNDPFSILESMPILEKSTVLNNYSSFVSDNYKGKRLITEETSGSTGTPLKIFCNKSAYSFNHALGLTRWKEWADVKMNDKKIMFGGKPIISIYQKQPPFWVKNYAENQMYCSIYHLSIEMLPFYDHAIRNFKPKYIMEYPSAIYLYANFLYRRKKKLTGLKAVLTGSENLTDDKRKVIEDVFECKVYDSYSLAEYVNYITECKFGSYHISPEAGIVEILNEDGSKVVGESIGKIISSTLFNYAMPLLRYNTGDIGSMSNRQNNNCKCGRMLPVLKTLDGRMMSFILLPNGSLIGSAGLSTAFHSKNLIESQIIQESKNEVLLKLVVTKFFTDIDLRNLLNGLNKRIKPLKIKYKFVNSIDISPNGKRPWIINKCKVN